MRKTWKQRVASALFGMMLGLAVPSMLVAPVITSVPARAADATLLPDAKQQYLDDAGNPVASGSVGYYVPSTSTKKTVWQNAAKTVLQTNPVPLDAAGRPEPGGQTFGDGVYRQVVRDASNVVIWDALTTSTGGNGGTTPVSTVGDGLIVGSILPWSGIVPPPNYIFAAGQQLSRTAYPLLLATTTITVNAVCTVGFNVLSGLNSNDTQSIPVGAKVEATCVPPGTSIIAVGPNAITLSANAAVSAVASVVVYPFGNGNGSTTFNAPDLRGLALVGRNNMLGTQSSHMQTQYFDSGVVPGIVTPNAIGAIGGSDNTILRLPNLPAYTPAGTITNGTITSTYTGTPIQQALGPGGGAEGWSTGSLGHSVPTGTVVSTQASSVFTGTAQGGTSTALSRVSPSLTMNYVIKALPDTSSLVATGVASLGLMTGVIACGTNVTCAGNTVSVALPPNTYSGNVVYVESCGATGDGVTDDAPAIRTCRDQVVAAGGGTVGFSCNATYLLASKEANGLSIFYPASNVTWVGCGDNSILKVANGMNTGGTQFAVFYPPDETGANVYVNTTFKDFQINFNGANNNCCNYQNVGIAIRFGNTVRIEGMMFANHPGSQGISLAGAGGLQVGNVWVLNNKFVNSCDLVNPNCLDHSSVYTDASNVVVDSNICTNTTQSYVANCIESHGVNHVVSNNSVTNEFRFANIAADTGHESSAITVTGNTITTTLSGITFFSAAGNTLKDITIANNTFQRALLPPSFGAGLGYFDLSVANSRLQSNIKIIGNTFILSPIAATAATDPTIVLGDVAQLTIENNVINGSMGPCMVSGPAAFSSSASMNIINNTLINCGQTTTAASQRGILINSVPAADRIVLSGNVVQNVGGTYATTGIVVSTNATYGYVAPNNFVRNIATETSITGTGFVSTTANGMMLANLAGTPLTSTAAMTNGQLVVGQTGAAPLPKTISGDWTLSAAGLSTLGTVNANVGAFGDSTHVGQFTVNGKGLITAASSVLITGAAPTGAAGGDLTGNYPNPTLNTVNANVGSFGDGTHVGQFTVNGKGLITAASSVLVTGAAPTGAAGGDLTGTYPNPTLGAVIAAGGPTGSATVAPIVTYDAKGRLTAVSSATVTPAVGSITGLGTGTAIALGVNVGSNGAFVTRGGDLGSPSAVGTMPAFTQGGTISGGGNQLNNIIIGTTSPLAGSFTTLATTGNATLNVPANNGIFIQDSGSTEVAFSWNGANGGYFQINDAAFAQSLLFSGVGTSSIRNSLLVGGTSATLSDKEFGLAKMTASGTAPGAGFLKMGVVAGASAGTCKLIAYAGTSTTPTTIIDNIGSGC